MTLIKLRASLKVFKEDYTAKLTDEERASLCEIMGAVDRLEAQEVERIRAVAKRKLEILFCRIESGAEPAISHEDLIRLTRESGVEVYKPSLDRRWWEFWK